MDPVVAFGDFLRPVLEEAGFVLEGEAWTSRRGEARWTIRGRRDSFGRSLEAGVGFGGEPELLTLIRVTA